MAQSTEEFLLSILRQMGRLGVFKAKQVIPSRTLRRATIFRETSRLAGGVYIPHYWAIYLHDGTGVRSAKGGKYLVWFRDSKQDPRLPAGYTPERYIQTTHLTKAAFQQGLRDNKTARDAGLPEPMIVRLTAKGLPATNFFSNSGGFKGFSKQVNNSVNGESFDFIRSLLGPELLSVKTKKVTIVLGRSR